MTPPSGGVRMRGNFPNPETPVATPDFDSLCDIFSDNPVIGQNPAELHGLGCGILAAGFNPGPEHWLDQVMEYWGLDAIEEHQRSPLYELLESSQHLLSKDAFEFQLCLPDDEVYGLAERLDSLSSWCVGFLHGFAALQADLSEEAEELVTDMTEISRLEIDCEEDDESEGYYIELVEFVRMAAVSLFMEYAPKQEESQHVRH